MNFNELELSDELLKAITEIGFETATPIQQQSIPILRSGDTDFVGLAQTGTGKTAAFGLPLMEQITSKNEVQAIILCPTRELCLQTSKELTKFSKYLPKVNITSIYGGVAISNQIRALKKGVQIVVGTPGRVIDHIQRGTLNLSNIKYVILDEADEMLNMGFKQDMDTILKETPKEKNVWLFSATMPREIEQMAKNYMENPQKVVVGAQNSGNENITHQYCVVRPNDFFEAVTRFIDFYPDMFGLLFCRTKRDTQNYADKLIAQGINAEALHGDLSQGQRDLVMSKFRNKAVQLLVATDVAARGIDVNDVTHVFHMGIPDDIESYTHRSGRTARAGKKGFSISIVGPRDSRKISLIEKQVKTSVELVKVPGKKEIIAAQQTNLVNLIKDNHQSEIDESIIKSIQEELTDVTKEQLIASFSSYFIKTILDKYNRTSDLNIAASKSTRNDSRNSNDRYERASSKRSINKYDDTDSKRLFINIGAKDGFQKGSLLGFICNQSGIEGSDIGKIDVLNEFSFFGVNSEEIATEMINRLNNKKIEGRDIRIEFSSAKKSGGTSEKGGNRGGARNGFKRKFENKKKGNREFSRKRS